MSDGDGLEALLESGKRKGYVHYDELDALLPEDCESGPELDAVLAALEKAGVRVAVRPSDDADAPASVGDVPTSVFIDDPVRVYENEIGKVAPLSREAEIRLTKAIHGGTEEPERAKKDLVEANLREVVAIAKCYRDRGVHLLDLIQEGNNGLIKAADTFDYTRGYRFSAYAGWLARRFVIRATMRPRMEPKILPHMKPPDRVQ